MTVKEVVKMFEGYEKFVDIYLVYETIWISVIDFLGFDEYGHEIEQEIPIEVYDRVSACELAGIHVDYTSMDI